MTALIYYTRYVIEYANKDAAKNVIWRLRDDFAKQKAATEQLEFLRKRAANPEYQQARTMQHKYRLVMAVTTKTVIQA